MKIIDCEQGSPPWFQARMGKPTASQFHRILTPKTRKYSEQARLYAYRLAAERLLGRPLETFEATEWMERGRSEEKAAVRLYEFERGVETVRCGLLLTDDGRIGASPDRLIKGQPASLEVKCPAPWTHLQCMREGFGENHIVQAQGQILVGELEWCDRYSYHGEMPPCVVRAYRDEAFLADLRAALDRFCDTLDEIELWGRKSGFFADRLVTPTDAMAAALAGAASGSAG